MSNTPSLSSRLLQQSIVQGNFDINELASDPFLSRLGGTRPITPDKLQGMFYEGMVSYFLPGCNCYRVTRSGFQTEIMCCDLQSSSDVFATRSYQTYPVGSRVFIYVPTHRDYGYILGVIPDLTIDGTLNWSDHITATNIDDVDGLKNVFNSFPHRAILSSDNFVNAFKTWCSSKPLDTTCLGDYGLTTALGGGLHLDMFMAFLKATEENGLWLFYLNQLTRLKGSNMDIYSAAHAEEYRNDEGETTTYRGEVLYPWERFGEVRPGFETDEGSPYFRTEYYGGYLGQGMLRQMSFTMPEDPRILTGIFKETVGSDGGYFLQSAKSIRLSKRAVIKIPKRIHPQESADGDDRAAGNHNFDFDDKESIRADISNVSGEAPGLQRAAIELDANAYVANWRGMHQFINHENDFEIPKAEEMELSQLNSTSAILANLKTKTYAGSPDHVSMDIGAKLDALMYFLSRADIAILEDGTVVLRGAYGEEIKMIEGSIELSCPGDIKLMPGRSLITMSGDDTIIKANKAIDIVSNESDVRFKAENNMEFVSGVSGRGRMLVENKSTLAPVLSGVSNREGEDIVSGGITLKASESSVASYGRSIYMRSLDSGTILLDADRGKGQLLGVGQTITWTSLSTINSCIVASADSLTPLNNLTVSQYATTILSDTNILGSLLATQSVSAGTNLFADNGHIYTSLAMQGDMYMYVFGRSRDQVGLTAVQERNQNIQNQAQTYSSNMVTNTSNRWTQIAWDDNRFGSDMFISQFEFSHRTDKQYGTEDFILCQPYWQQINDVSQLTAWKENYLMYQGRQQAAYPGISAWKERQTLYNIELQLYDPETGTESENYDDYRNYESPEWDKQIPDGNYKIIVRV